VKKWLIGLVPATIIVILLAYIVGSHAIPQSVQDNLANAASSPDISGLPDDNVAGAVPEAPANAATVESPYDNAMQEIGKDQPANATADSSTGNRDDADDEAQARREVAAAVRGATLRALVSGEPAHWHKDGLVGDVVVSEPQDDGSGGSCRTVSATMGADEDDLKQSGDHIWCQPADGGDWAPQ